jgi:hypothetical protein
MSATDCTHETEPRTYYARQGSQLASNYPYGVSGTNGGWPVEFFGFLCDECARKAGLLPVAFGRPLKDDHIDGGAS